MSIDMTSYIQSSMNHQEKDKIRSLLAKRLENSSQRTTEIQKQNISEYEVSAIQRHMLEHEEIHEEMGAYNLVASVDIWGKLDHPALEHAIHGLVQENSALRTGFAKTAEGYRQYIVEEAAIEVEYIDISNVKEYEKELDGIITHRALQKLRFDMAPLLRVSSIQLAPEHYVLILVTHHTIADGWSFGVIIRRLQEAYNSYCQNSSQSLIPEKINAIDYLIWKKNIKCDSADYWKKELADAPILRLESDGEREITASYQGRRLYFTIEQSLADAMRDYEKTYKITMSNIVMSAYQIVLSKYTGQKDFVVGMAVAGRENLAVRNMIGCFINTLGMRAAVKDEMRIEDYLKQVQTKFYEIMEHKEIDIYDCLEDISYERDNHFPPLLQVMYNYENTPKSNIDFCGLEIEARNIEVCNALFDLTLSIFDTGKDLNGFIEYKSGLFLPNRIKQLLQCLLHVMEVITGAEEMCIKEISLLSPKQERELLQLNDRKEWQTELFLDRFRQMAVRWSSRDAVCFGDNHISYEQLDELSNRVADRLQRQTKPKALIGVFMDKSTEAIVAMLSIFKAGMTYVPIDPGYPEERIQYMIEDARIETVITHRKITDDMDLQALGIKNVSDIEQLWKDETKTGEAEHTEIKIDLEDTAYLIYTSGSTGKPKGVMVPHRGLCNVIEEQKQLFAVSETSRVLQFASFCFDASIFEILMALGNGAALYVVDKQKVLGNQLAKFIQKEEITHICVTPSVLSLTSPVGLEKLETIIVAGEACPEELVRVWSGEHAFFNAYGPTEATIWTTTARCLPDRKVTIGKPIKQVEVFVLDAQLNLVPKGSSGELYIGGIGVCKGYLNREELNEQKFIRKKFPDGYETTLYVSGDIVRWNEEKELEFLGRKDRQVKLRGFRVETDEIRAKILEYPNVCDAVVGVVKKGGTDVLYAAVKTEEKSEDTQPIRHFLQDKLPYYMIPAILCIIEEIPLTWNGKIDTKALEESYILPRQEERSIREPETDMQRRLLLLWQVALGTDEIGVDDNFFELGGHSLTATKLVNGINEQLQAEFTTSMVFRCPTILEMEEQIKKSGTGMELPMKRAKRQERYLLTPQQKQLWFMEQMYESNGSYHIVMPIWLKGRLGIEELEKSFCFIIDRHEILRANFHEEGGIPYQRVNRSAQFRLNHYHLMNFEAAQTAAPVESIIRSISKRGFDLGRDLLVRASLIHLREEECILVVVMHHIISDGWSMELFVEELSQVYNYYLGQKENVMQQEVPQSLQYLDYICWLEHQAELREKQKGFWKEVLAPEVGIVSVPTDYKRPKLQTHNGYTVMQELDEVVTLQIKKFCTEKKVTVFMFMLSVYSILLHKLTGKSDIPVGVPVAGRAKKEMESMLGFFVNTLVMRCSVFPEQTISECLDRIKSVSLLAFENQEVSFEELVQAVCPNRDTSRPPLVQVMLNVQNPDGIQCCMKGLEAAPYPVVQESTKFDMTLYVEEYFGKIKFRLVYNRDLYKEKRMQEFLRQLHAIVGAVLQNDTIEVKDISIRSIAFTELLQKEEIKSIQKGESGMRCLDEVIAENAKKYAGRIAVLDEKETLTYSQLEDAAKRLAFVLAGMQIGRGSVVILYGTRSIRLVVSILAVLKTGASFCIFDSEYPEERLRKQFDVIDAKGAIIIPNEMPEKIELMCHNLAFCETYEKLLESAEVQKLENRDIERDAEDIAYVMFTSGTTGEPNCVATSHSPVFHFLQWFIAHYHIEEDCVFGLFAGLAHDPLIREIFTPLFAGGRLAIQNQESKYDLENCSKWIEEQGINEVNITPSLFMMITEGMSDRLTQIRHYFFGGEGLSAVQIQRVRTISPGAQCANFYGATETPQVMGYYDVPEDFDVERESVPIQGGIDGVRIFVVNENGYESGVGEAGEIWIETPHLSRGYINNESLNREKFTASVKYAGWRVYRTGDIGRYQPDGSIIIEGRKDSQINVRGYRVETKEIEMTLLSHENVRNAVVCLIDLKGRNVLAAYLTVRDEAGFEAGEMRRFLTAYLPVNVLPERFILIESIPLTPNGKVDYRKLPKEFDEPLSVAAAPRDEVEEKIKKIWSELLMTDHFGVDENFFDIGGHSLLLSQMRVLLEEEFQIEIKLIDLFSYPSVALIGDYIKSRREGSKRETEQLSEEVQERARRQRKSFDKFKRTRE